MPATLRLLLTLRWLGWTLLAAVIVVGCFGMSWWQLTRAESPDGSLLNAGYAAQWPLFGVFFAALWWRMLRAEARALDAVAAREHEWLPAPVPAAGADDGAAPSPFGPRPAGTALGDGQGAVVPGSARAEYNAMLAALARGEEEDRTP